MMTSLGPGSTVGKKGENIAARVEKKLSASPPLSSLTDFCCITLFLSFPSIRSLLPGYIMTKS